MCSHLTCAHVFPVTALFAFRPATPKRLPSSAKVTSPAAYNRRISRTESSVNFDRPWFSPRACCDGRTRLQAFPKLRWRSPRHWRPFCLMSALLSAGVPRNRWAGFTHRRLSQVWHTNLSEATEPCVRTQPTRCAPSEVVPLPPVRKTPYPSLLSRAVQSQHGSLVNGTSTFDQNRNSAVSFRIMSADYSKSVVGTVVFTSSSEAEPSK